MRRDSLLRSTPLRLALVFALVFLGAFLATGIVVYELMKFELVRRQDHALKDSYAVIANAYGDHDLTDLLETVAANVRTTRAHERVFLVLGADGEVLGGNIPSVSVPDGFSQVPGAALGLEQDMTYRLLAGTVDGNRLVVGRSRAEIDSLEEIVLASFAWASIIVGLVAACGGTFIALRVRRRFNAVRNTMERVSHGELAARIPLIGRGDDVDLLSQDINDALERLATTVEGMRQVSADIAHDLKTPLNRLKLIVENARDRQERGESVVEQLDLAAAEADRINETFEALLRIAQIEAGARKARFGPVDLRAALASLAEIYAGVAEDAGQALSAELPGDGAVEVSGDRELLVQMFANLIENAIRHCPPGTRIVVGGRRGGDGEVTTWVADDGPGIPEAERQKVFRRLYRIEKSRTSSGSGLGLSLVKAVADLHGAAIRLEDAAPGLRASVAFAGRRSE